MLSNFDLDSICQHYSVPLKGIYLRDQLPASPENGLTIINLDRAFDFDGPVGTHWTALFCDDSACVYCDSFGAPAPTDVDKWIKGRYRKYGHNAWIIQSVKSNCCGFYTVAFGLFCTKKRKKNEGLVACVDRYVNMFGERGNEKILREFLISAGGLPVHELVIKKCK